MSLGPRLDLRQSQQLVMTPQLQQAIKLLTLTNLELESFVVGEIEKNPLLEPAGEDGPAAESETPQNDDGGAVADGGDGESGDYDAADPMTADRLIAAGDGATDAPLDVDYVAETFHHDSGSDLPSQGLDGSLGLNGGGAAATGGGEAPTEGFEALLCEDQSLADLLLAQAGTALAGIDLAVAQHLIDLIDEAGYLVGSLAEGAERRSTDVAHVERVLTVIQGFEPTGVGARSLAECLRIQAVEADRCDPAMARLLDNLHLLARGDMGALRRICGVDQDDLTDMIHELRAYNPKPGLAFGGERVQTVVPDIYVARTPAGWAVELNSATLPKLLVNRSYYVELTAGTKSREARSFLSDCLASANWLVKALDQRARTIVKVATEIVRQQQAFFEHGVHHLKPLNLRAIAEAIGMHESTISRVTSNKYLSCDRGLFELKFFFTSAIQSSDGDEAVSSEAVKSRIRALIAAETADTILSDDKLVEVLKGEGFDIARRTVAKYREAMGLGSSVQRRRAALLNGARAA